MARAPAGSEKELFLYEAAFATTFSMDGPEANTAFEKLFALADDRAELRAVRDASMSCALPSGLLNRPPRDDGDTEHDLGELQRRNFQNDTDAIRNGSHLGWLELGGAGLFQPVLRRR